MSNKKTLVLAYSGGLDTSVILHWLTSCGYDVIALYVEIGQLGDSHDEVRRKGLASGAREVVIEDVRAEFVADYVMPSLQFHALYEGVYLLGTSLARPLISKAQIEVAQRFGAEYVAHGATGKGNDQVRFELCYYALNPDIKIIAPWKMPEFYTKLPGRRELIAYAEEHSIPVKATLAQPWSSDDNLMHVSYEAGMLEDPWQEPQPNMFELTKDLADTPEQSEEITLGFKRGVPISLNGKEMSLMDIFIELNRLGGVHGIGRIDMVESRYVGMKSRGVYETPGGTILNAMHRAVESLVLDRDTISLKDSLALRFAYKAYDGYWFTREMELLLNLVEQSQRDVEGEVKAKLWRGNVQILGRRSPNSVYDELIASMDDDQGSYTPTHARGFIDLHAIPLKAYHRQQKAIRQRHE